MNLALAIFCVGLLLLIIFLFMMIRSIVKSQTSNLRTTQAILRELRLRIDSMELQQNQLKGRISTRSVDR